MNTLHCMTVSIRSGPKDHWQVKEIGGKILFPPWACVRVANNRVSGVKGSWDGNAVSLELSLGGLCKAGGILTGNPDCHQANGLGRKPGLSHAPELKRLQVVSAAPPIHPYSILRTPSVTVGVRTTTPYSVLHTAKTGNPARISPHRASRSAFGKFGRPTSKFVRSCRPMGSHLARERDPADWEVWDERITESTLSCGCFKIQEAEDALLRLWFVHSVLLVLRRSRHLHLALCCEKPPPRSTHSAAELSDTGRLFLAPTQYRPSARRSRQHLAAGRRKTPLSFLLSS